MLQDSFLDVRKPGAYLDWTGEGSPDGQPDDSCWRREELTCLNRTNSAAAVVGSLLFHTFSFPAGLPSRVNYVSTAPPPIVC